MTGLFNASTGTFTNAAQINIGTVRVQTRGIENQGTFTNTIGGVITIGEVRSNANGIIGGLVNTGGTFTNTAQIIMGQTLTPFGNQGNGLVNQATFNNNPGGTITIDQVSGAGIVSLNGGNFTNAARITIGASTTVGTAIESQGESISTFTNAVGGVITLDRAKTAGLVNRVANFTNEGKITIGAIAAVGGLAIQNSYLFDNSGCGALINVVSNDVISQSGGAITNSGTIIENSENVNQIYSNTGIVQNNNGGFFYVGTGPNQPLSVSATNPTNCISPNGALTLTGLRATTSYTLSYTVGGSTTTLNPTSNASGQFTISNLGVGSYALTLSGSCVPLPLSLSATLTGPSLTASSPVKTVATLGVSFSQSFTATGGTGPYSFSQTAGSLPAGLSLSSTGILSGTPTVAGFYGIVVQATDASGCPGNSASATYSFSVQTPSPDLTPVLYARPSTLYGNAPLTVVVDVFELNGVATSGLITLRINKDPKVSLSLNNSLNSVGGRSVQNSVWSLDVDSDLDYYLLTTSQPIAGGNILSVGLSGQLNPGATSGLLTVSTVVAEGSGGEGNVTNNADADRIEYFQQ
ncbi:Ig domain-containing protein [Spirosoma sp. KNUC1025]|uniref:beta strand repeat-containing protein n=1 Tax=Spirosoma sp. KNUC1025 TaxID=2894082 RepID=UPI00386A16DA|nr:Ig domain-containing protein [Spirosoma sp. KNUC1025]